MAVIVNASRDWDWDDIQPHVGDIKACFRKLGERFPDDLTEQTQINEVLSGEKGLWVILVDGKVKATALTKLRTIDATGVKFASLVDLAGEGVELWADDLCRALETWADENGADVMSVEGRVGWMPLLKKKGYSPFAVSMRKRVKRAA